MKKYFLLTAIFAALLLTACGNNQVGIVETSVQVSEVALNSITDLTVPAFEPECGGTNVTSQGYTPNSDEQEFTTTSVCSEPLQTVEFFTETTVETHLSMSALPIDASLDENEYAAYITDVFENKNGGYSLVIEAYDVAGYYSPVPISLYSEKEFSVGDWVKVEFAPETCFMETSPMQVAKQDTLNIELIDY